MKINKILIIDEDSDFRKLLEIVLLKISPSSRIDQYDPLASGRPGENFNWSQYDLLFLDYDLGHGGNGLDWLLEYKNNEPFPATIIITAHGNEEIAARSIRLGAHDYISKHKMSNNSLIEVINNALKVQSEQSKFVTTQELHTKLFNKVYFYKKLGEIIEKRSPDNLSFVLQVMIDEFQQIRKDLGFLGADHLVSEVAEEISNILVNSQHQVNVTRIGDSSIGCLLSGKFNEKDGEKFAGTLCVKLADKSFIYNDKRIPLSVSIGVAQITKSDNSVESLLEHVDLACNSASEIKGNSFTIYADTEHASSHEIHNEIEKQPDPLFNLNDAIENNRVQPYFQHMIAMSESATMFDADLTQLHVRLIDQDGNRFILDDIKNTRLNDDDRGLLDRWLIRFSLGKLLSSNSTDDILKQGLFIPLSRVSLITPDFSGWMTKLILKTKITNIASTIVFEISTTDFLSSKENTLSIMNFMRDKWGVSFELTDVSDVSELNKCLQRGGFEFVKFNLDKDKISEMREVAISCKEFGSLTILGNIQDEEGRAYASHADIDFVLGDFIQPPKDELEYIKKNIDEKTL
jgi:diguanylate cyclase (GGDEF)-like protein